MARWPQREHSSTWPPSAAVRHRSMATSTLTCSQVSQAGCRSMSLCPAARMMSANSRSGRVIYRVYAGVSGNFDADLNGSEIQRAGGGSEMHLRHGQVAARGFQIRMAEQKVNGAQVGTRFEEMRGEAMAKRVRMDTLLQAGALGGVFDRVEDALGAHRHIGRVSTASTGEEVGFGPETRAQPIFAKLFEQPWAKHDVAILIALALVDVNQHAGTVDIIHFQLHQFFAS